jgi:gluconolactonase
LERFDPATGQRETLLADVGGRTLTSSNYPVIDRAGNIWCANSTHAPTWPDALDGRPDGFLFVLRPDGSSQIVAEGLCFPNGLALSADKNFLYCAQTSAGDVLRFEILPGETLGKGERYGPKLGLVARRKLNPNLHLPSFIQSRLGYTDGVGLDVEGNLWVCLPAANKVVAITPKGRKITVIHDPSGKVVNHPTNVTWGGPDLRDLYIGSIRANYVLKAQSPVAGLALVHQL